MFADEELYLLVTLGMKNDEISPAERVDLAELMCLLTCSQHKDAGKSLLLIFIDQV